MKSQVLNTNNTYNYRINSTHIFLAGGYAGPSTLCGIETKKEEINPVGKKPSFCEDPEVAPDAYTGGLVLNKAFMYNGLAWEELPPMSVRRDTPICSLIHNEDQVILLIYVCIISIF